MPALTVLLPIHNSFEAVCRCLHSLHNDTNPLDAAITKLVLINDASTDTRISPRLKEFRNQTPRVELIEQNTNLGYLASVNRQLERVTGAVVLLNSDTVVTRDWATRLQAGAKRYPRLGALTPLSNNATFSTIRDPNDRRRALTREDLPRIEALLEKRTGCDYPLAPTGMGFCLLITALARSIAPKFNATFAPGYEEENDLCQTLRAHGLQCRIASDVYVHHEGGESFGPDKAGLQKRHYELIQQQHPAYAALVQDWFERLDQPYDLLPGANNSKPLRLLLEAEVLSQSLTGVVRYLDTLIELLHPSINRGDLKVSAVVSDTGTQKRYQSSTPQVEWLTGSDLDSQGQRWDIYHLCHANIPFEVVQRRRRHASRLVVSLHDLIAFENPSYFANGESFLSYRQQLRELTGLADHVLAISENTLRDGLEQLQLTHQRCSVFANPLCHLQISPEPEQKNWPPAERFCLIVGTDFRHKHLLGSVELFRDALLPLDPQLKLVLVGPEVAHGGCLTELKTLLNRDKTLERAVHIEGAVSDARLTSLYKSAELVLYLSLQEGFGYIPYEAAMHHCPTVVANTSVYTELPNWVAVDPYSCPRTNSVLAQLLNDPACRKINVQVWQQQLAYDQQRDHAQELLSVYCQVLNTPRHPYAKWLVKPQLESTAPHVSASRLRRLAILLPASVKQGLRRSQRWLQQQKI
ncbi:glycosyl transferases group 1 family protein [Synechococcus sp. BIOS-U3-1]|uniref:glycosyltransferase n=1 Tax=Synechococcus sp. BIOS-U3-1 TaxID=1400865 RepID=UPI0016442F35|nr:glycosyltransferase [Synechococcus sp. BIOS-U3-1]QNI57150.1 glycosyl transferases group 1 family protein [Synechococcus sp. BIOS-U3-1]